MISQTTEYALRAMVFLAMESDTPRTAQKVAERTKVTTGYMSKVLQSLGEAGLLEAQRGRYGGFILARPAEEITILDIVNAIDPLRRIERCPLGIPGHQRLCPLHQRLDDAVSMIERAFRGTTLAELLSEPSASKPLCDEDRADDAAGAAGPKPGARTGRKPAGRT